MENRSPVRGLITSKNNYKNFLIKNSKNKFLIKHLLYILYTAREITHILPSAQQHIHLHQNR